jgi:hypothetical protein
MMIAMVRHVAGLLLALWFGWVYGLSLRAVKFRRSRDDSRGKKVWLWMEGVLFLFGTLLMPVSVFVLMSANLKSAWTILAVIMFFAGMMSSVYSTTEGDSRPDAPNGTPPGDSPSPQ